MSIEDVTERVNAAVKPEMTPAEAFAARRAVMAAIEKESLDKTGLRSDVVTLYQGGQYHLYRYKKYTDVRLVFAPEQRHRLLRRRPRQLRVSALRPRHLLLPRLRGRQAGQGRALSASGARRGRRTASWSSSPAIPARPTGWTRWPSCEHRRDVTLPYTLNRLRHAGGAAAAVQRTRARSSARHGARTTCSASPTPARRSPASTRACSTRPSWRARRRRSEPARQRSPPTRTSRRPHGAAWDRIAARREGAGRASSATTTCWSAATPSTRELFHIARHLVRLADGAAEAQRRAAARVPRLEPRIAEVPALLAGADLPRPGAGQAGRLAVASWPRTWAASIRWS